LPLNPAPHSDVRHETGARRWAPRYAAFDAARAFLCAMAAIGQKPDIRLREEMGVDMG